MADDPCHGPANPSKVVLGTGTAPRAPWVVVLTRQVELVQLWMPGARDKEGAA